VKSRRAEERRQSTLERERSRVGRREVGSGARLGLGGVQDPVACFAQDEVGEGGK
jgi:hypothetical protein